MTASATNFLALMHLHFIFVVTAIIAGILIAIWMVKNLPKQKLLNYSVIILLVAILGILVTSSFGPERFFGKARLMMSTNATQEEHVEGDEHEPGEHFDEMQEMMERRGF